MCPGQRPEITSIAGRLRRGLLGHNGSWKTPTNSTKPARLSAESSHVLLLPVCAAGIRAKATAPSSMLRLWLPATFGLAEVRSRKNCATLPTSRRAQEDRRTEPPWKRVHAFASLPTASSSRSRKRMLSPAKSIESGAYRIVLAEKLNLKTLHFLH